MTNKKAPVTRPHGGQHYKPRAKTRHKAFTYEDLQRLQALSLDEKISYARAKIEEALAKMQVPCLAFSAGKDSTVLLHLLRQYRPDILVNYGNTTIEFPECVRFARQLACDWDLNYHEAKPDVTFWWVVENYGWPLLGKEFGVSGVAHKSSREQFFADRVGDPDLAEFAQLTGLDRQYAIQQKVPISSACCTFLKERPSHHLQKAQGVDGVFLGILAAESRLRTFNFLEYGDLYFPASQKLWKAHPLSIWTDDDIWSYIRRFDVPYASLYDMGYHDEKTGEWISHKRNGCMFCGMDLAFPNNHFSIMRRTHPKAWNVAMVHKGLGRILLQLRLALDNYQLDMFEQGMGLAGYLERFPCAFDRV